MVSLTLADPAAFVSVVVGGHCDRSQKVAEIMNKEKSDPNGFDTDGRLS
jgi:hypothetical protein